MRKFLPQSDTEKLVYPIVSSCLDSCSLSVKLQPIACLQNAATHLVVHARKFGHVSDIQIHLHWLPIHERINYKFVLLMYEP